MHQRILITGGAGFIGSHLVDELLDKNYVDCLVVADNFSSGSMSNLEHIDDDRLKIFEGDVCNQKWLSQIIISNQIDAVCHLAVSPLVASISHPRMVVENIISMQLSVLECLRLGLYKKLVTFSTSEVYGSSDGVILDENSTLSPQTPYASAKAAGDLLTQSYIHSFTDQINCTIVRPFNNYGSRKRVLPGAGIIPQAISALVNNNPLTLYSGGESKRDYVYVKDTARAVRLILENDEITRNKIYVVASGVSRSMNSIVKDIEAIVGKELRIHDGGQRAGDVTSLLGSASRIKHDLGFETQMDWIDGLKNAVSYYTYENGKLFIDELNEKIVVTE